MLVATLIMVLGIATVAIVSHRHGYRLGGVMVLPLLVIYTFREPLSPLIFVAGTVAAWGALWVVREYTLNYGRRVFLVAIVAGVCATVLAALVVDSATSVRFQFDDAEIVASIFPGVAAYNLMRLDREDRVFDVVAMVVLFFGLLLVGAVALLAFQGRPAVTPPILAAPTSVIGGWLHVEPRGEAITRLTPEWLSLTLLVVDVVVYEGVRKRYDLRLAGIIIIPLLAVFSVRFVHVPAIFALGATVVYVMLSVVHWVSLLYGRVLLGVSLVLGSLYALGASLFVPHDIPGLTLFFIGLFVGIAAYNLYYVAPSLRGANLRLSAGLFVVFYAVLVVFVDVPPGGLYHDGGPVYALVGMLAIGLALVELLRLERSRPSLADFAGASVFANVDVDGADVEDSPLVDSENESGTWPARRIHDWWGDADG